MGSGNPDRIRNPRRLVPICRLQSASVHIARAIGSIRRICGDSADIEPDKGTVSNRLNNLTNSL